MAYTVPYCKNLTGDQDHYITYPWNECIYDTKSEAFAIVSGRTNEKPADEKETGSLNIYLMKGAILMSFTVWSLF